MMNKKRTPRVLVAGFCAALLFAACTTDPFVFGPQPREEVVNLDVETAMERSGVVLEEMGFRLSRSERRLEGFTPVRHNSRFRDAVQQRVVIEFAEDQQPDRSQVRLWFSRIEETDDSVHGRRSHEIFLRDPRLAEHFFERLEQG